MADPGEKEGGGDQKLAQMGEAAVREIGGCMQVSSEVCERAAVLLRSNLLILKEVEEDDMKYWAACALMAASCSSKPLPVASVMRAAGSQLKVTDFFERTKVTLRGDTSKSQNGEFCVRRIERAFMVTADVFRKFKSMFAKAVSRDSAATESSSGKPSVFRVLWLLFISYKGEIFRSGNERSPLLDQVPAFHFLVACIAFATFNVTAIGSDEGEEPPRKLAKLGDSSSARTLSALCADTDAIESDVRHYIDSLKSVVGADVRSLLPVSARSEPSALNTLYEKLAANYEEQLMDGTGGGSVDERIFTDSPDLLGLYEAPDKRDTSRKAHRAPFHPSPLPARPRGISGDALDALATVAFMTPRSPCGSTPTRSGPNQPQTPISVSVIAVAWLQNVCRSRPEVAEGASKTPAPSVTLQRFFGDAWQTVHGRAYRLLRKALLKVYPAEVAERRVREALAVYLTSLEGILVSEEKRLKVSNFDSLLQNGTFHRALLACAAESASIAYGRREFAPFPGVLEDFDLEPFDMTKVTESFLRYTAGLPKTIARHLARCEEKILESLAWRPRSQLLQALEHREKVFEAEKRKDGPESEDRDDSDLMSFSQGTADILSASQLADSQGDSQGDAEEEEEHAEDTLQEEDTRNGGLSGVIPDAALELFFRKLLFITSYRVQDLCARADLSRAQAESVWKAMKAILTDKWRLMEGRHLDQMIICCVYGVAKVNRDTPAPKFSDITQWYKTLPHTRDASFQPQVHAIYTKVRLNPDAGEAYGDIIAFYNQVFVQHMKDFLLQLRRNAVDHDAAKDNTKAEQAEPECRDPIKAQVYSSPMQQRRRTRENESPRVVGKVKVTAMSPGSRRQLSKAEFGTGLLSPSTKTLYAFGESPVMDIRRLNRAVDLGRRLQVGKDQSAGVEGPAASAIRRKYGDVFAVRSVDDATGDKDRGSGMLRIRPAVLSRGPPPVPPPKPGDAHAAED